MQLLTPVFLRTPKTSTLVCLRIFKTSEGPLANFATPQSGALITLITNNCKCRIHNSIYLVSSNQVIKLFLVFIVFTKGYKSIRNA